MKNSLHYISAVLILILFASCSATSAIEDGEQLYTGLKKIEYKNYERNEHFIVTQEEIDAALAAVPNGALFGSSFYRTPFPTGLWIWNATEGKEGAIAKWLNSSFGTVPVLMSDVNPALRASVARSTLASYGYFRGSVDYEELTMKNPKEGKIAYTVNMDHLFTLDSISYANYGEGMDSLVQSTSHESVLKQGDGFNVSLLDLERQRLSSLFRNNGYYFYQPGYSSYLADTLQVPGKVQLRLQMADSLDPKVYRQWLIGNTDIIMRRLSDASTPDTLKRRSLTIHFNGKKSPIRPRVILSNLKLRPGRPFSEDAYNESVSRLSANETFSMIDIHFTPRDTTSECRLLDMTVDCLFDKPYDLSIEGNLTGKTSSRIGPGAELSFTKRNAFRGGEKLSLNAFGSYEWQTGSSGSAGKVGLNSYEYGANLTLEMPRLLLPFLRRHRWQYAPSTLVKASNQVINRGSFFNRHIMSGELTYTFQPNDTRKHIFSPLILEYDYMNHASEEFKKILDENPYLYISMQDQFIPKMRYTFIYTSPERYRNPITWETTVSESANILSAGYALAGKKWNEKGKHLLRNPYAQFVRLETDFSKKWLVAEHTDLVFHVNAGVMYSYGNSEQAPYSEQFYVGGANSIRAFTVRSIGPGRYHTNVAGLSYLDQTGDIKFVANLEYRPRLFGNLYGALFLDAGNVWAMKNDGIRGDDSVFKPKNFLKDMALGTGVGIRYDLDFFVIRVDWGVGLHMPFDTGKSGYFNIHSFKDVHSLHLAVGYPF